MLARAPRRPRAAVGSAVPEQRAARALGRRLGLRERREDLLLELRRRARRAPRSCSPRPPRAAPATVVIPSSCQIRRAVFGPSPGRRMKLDDLLGHLRLALGQRVDLAVLDDLDDLLLDRLADPLQLLRLAVERELRDRAAVSRSALRRGGRRSTRKPSRALQLHQVGEQLELRGELGVPRESPAPSPAIDTAAADARDRLPPHLQRAREPRADGRRAAASVLRRATACSSIDDNSPTAPASSPTGSPREHAFVDVLHRARKEGLGPAYLAGFRRALADGAELSSRWTATSPTTPHDVPRLIAAAEDGADLVLGSRYVPGGGVANWGLRAARRSRAAARSTRSSSSACASATSPAASSASAACARDDRPRRDRLARLRVPDRDDVPRAACRASRVVEIPITFADRERGELEDEQVDRPRGGVEGAAAPARRARRYGARAIDVTDDELRGRGPARRRAGGRRLLGALVRPVQGGRARSSASSRPSTANASCS